MSYKLKLLIASALIVLGAVAFVFFGVSGHDKVESDAPTDAFYPIKEYRLISPIQQLNQADIDAVVKLYLGYSFWQLPLSRLQSELTRLDWVYSAEVRRVWPDTLLIRVEEQKPVVRWKEHGLLNRQGDLFYPANMNAFDNLVVLEGSELRTRQLLKILDELQQSLKVNDWVIRHLSEQADGVWRIETSQGLVVWLDPIDWQHKVKRWLAAYEQVVNDSRKVAHEIDLRYSNGFVIKQK